MWAATRIAAVVVAAAGLTFPAAAQDYGPYGYGGTGYGFDWNGFYAGVYGGGVPLGTTSASAGIFTGVNVAIDSAVFGVEAQLGADFAASPSLDALILGKGGMSFGQALAYATAGTGLVSGSMGYALGGGVEYGMTDYLTVRGEALGTGKWGAGMNDLRLAAGLALHL
ncbi:hypothetical protein [Pelagibacterium lacus]|uniref:Porin family protein n=1 Tax=Pelagibacterium lacus TaxID=2282655 RepID=A0A369W5R7_9HYPH|nr:hypothetical protein [Pelagibacterium lacus]RDE09205.1 hypothetical protein DVH29_06995 [Pelagibacterium lacus]